MSLFTRYGGGAGYPKMEKISSLSNFQVGQKISNNASLLTCFFLPVSELELCTANIVGQLFCLQVQWRKGRNVALQKSPEE